MTREDYYDEERREEESEDVCPGCNDLLDPSDACWDCDCCQDCCECWERE